MPTSPVGPQVTTTAQLVAAASGSLGVAGDTIWIRAGTYAKYPLTTTASGRTFRAWPGEHVRIDGALEILSANTTVWGLHVEPVTPQNIMGINVRGTGTKLINNVVTRAGMSGVGFWMEAPDSEATGNIVYHNGTHGNLDHGFYVQNKTGTKLIRDNLVFDNSAYGLHLYGETGQYVRGITLKDNVAWANGFAGARDDYFIGSSEVVSGIVVQGNGSWRANRGEQTVELPWSYGPKHLDLSETGNYFVGKVSVPATRWTTLTQSGNTTIGTTAPTVTRVVTHLNAYESGRAHVAVWNWGNKANVVVNVPGLGAYEVKRPNDMYGTPVVTGVGPAVTIPLSGQFSAFVVLPTS